MRCPNCSKFVSLEMQEPEENATDFDTETGEITADYRIYRTCAECGEEMKEATIEFSDNADPNFMEEHQGESHQLDAVFSAEPLEEGGGRYVKSFFGVDLTVEITCTCGATESVSLSEKIAASYMEELV